MILSCDIAEVLGTAARCISMEIGMVVAETDYFSTHGCNLLFSFVGGALVEFPLVAASSLRALRSKKFAMSTLSSGNEREGRRL